MKNRMSEKTKTILVILLLCITIGYAAIRSGLNINGTTHVVGATWDVHFENYQETENSNVDPTTPPDISGTDTTTIDYEVTLANPGDTYEFTMDVVNDGTVDTMIDDFVSTLGGVEIDGEHPLPSYLEYEVVYDDGVALADKQELIHATDEKVRVKVKYRDDIPTTDLPSTIQDLSFSFTITYVQADSSAIPVRPRERYIVTDQSMAIGQSVPIGVNLRLTPSAALADWVNIWPDDEYDYFSPYFIKLKLNSNNEIAESYTGFVISDEGKTRGISSDCYQGETACYAEYNNLVNGTYYIRGGVNEEGLETKPVYEANKAIIKEAFNYSTQPDICSETNYHGGVVGNGLTFGCWVDYYNVTIHEDGTAFAGDGGTFSCTTAPGNYGIECYFDPS